MGLPVGSWLRAFHWPLLQSLGPDLGRLQVGCRGQSGSPQHGLAQLQLPAPRQTHCSFHGASEFLALREQREGASLREFSSIRLPCPALCPALLLILCQPHCIWPPSTPVIWRALTLTGTCPTCRQSSERGPFQGCCIPGWTWYWSGPEAPASCQALQLAVGGDSAFPPATPATSLHFCSPTLYTTPILVADRHSVRAGPAPPPTMFYSQ